MTSNLNRSIPLLTQLALRLATGVTRLTEDYREETARFFLSTLDKNGGFRGRRGDGNLYYTGFAVRGLLLLEKLSKECPAIDFLKNSIHDELDAIEVISLLMSAVTVELATGRDIFMEKNIRRAEWGKTQLERFRHPDGGYASSPEAAYSSTYHTFLTVATLQFLGIPPEHEQEIAASILQRQRDDGGFVELPPLRRSGSNPTAAAISLLKMLGNRHDSKDFDDFVASAKPFLLGMTTEQGGFRAHAQISVPDLLSTFTVLVALDELDAVSMIDYDKTETFVRSLRKPNGGYTGGCWDTEPDVEYTFYGFATEALLHSYLNNQ